MNIAVVLVLCFVAIAASARVRYDDWQVVTVRNISDFARLELVAEKFGATVWGKNRGEETVDLMVPPGAVSNVMATYRNVEIAIENVQAEFDKEQQRLARAHPDDPFFDDFRSLEAVYNWLGSLSGVTIEDMPHNSIEGRPIKVAKLGTGSVDIIVIGTLHAREWITTTACTWMINELLKPENADYLNRFTWHIAPITNPDGYEYSWTTDRNWRKSRRVNAGTTARGVDLNRNFAKGFGGTGSSGNPSSGTYRGTAAFSEPEAMAIRDYVVKTDPAAFMDIHCCGSMWMHAWGFECSYPPHDQQLNVCGQAGVRGIADAGGSVWRQGTVCQVIYQASGITTDWVYDEDYLYAYTIEEPGSFVQPPSNIPLYGAQTFQGMKYWADCVAASKL